MQHNFRLPFYSLAVQESAAETASWSVQPFFSAQVTFVVSNIHKAKRGPCYVRHAGHVAMDAIYAWRVAIQPNKHSIEFVKRNEKVMKAD